MDSMTAIDFNALLKEYGDVIRLKVADLMTSGVISVTPDMHILKAASVMAGRRFRRIPVTENGVLVGMLSLGDVHKAIFHENISSSLSAA
jgi:CBS domain-containing protein